MSSVRRAVNEIDSRDVIYNVQTLNEVVSNSFAARRFSMILLGIFAALALLLACVGIYGVISYLVGQRTHEIGVRVALGAQRRDVLRLIIGNGAKMALIGVVIGVIAGLGLTRLMSNQLFGVSAHDPLTFAAVAILLNFVAVAACYIPPVGQCVLIRWSPYATISSSLLLRRNSRSQNCFTAFPQTGRLVLLSLFIQYIGQRLNGVRHSFAVRTVSVYSRSATNLRQNGSALSNFPQAM